MTTADKIRHLYGRAGFGLSPAEWAEKKNWQPARAVADLFDAAQKVQPDLETSDKDTALAKLGQLRKALEKKDLKMLRQDEKQEVGRHNTDWIERMGNPAHSALLEKMCLFWHGHFACRTRVPSLAVAQLNVLRRHALGNFRDLLLAVARDVSMIRFLNNQQNHKNKPNENFARELMELFTIGRGNYTEQDVKEAARAFTGWSSTLDDGFVFRRLDHDYGTKRFMGKTGDFNGEDIIDILLERRETAAFIARKAYRFFVNDQPDETHIAELAEVLFRSGYDIRSLMRHLFEADWFYAPANTGNRIKAPVELMAGLIRTLHATFDNPAGLLFVQHALGQVLFNPPNVAGWAGGRNWIDNATLMVRLNLAGYLYSLGEVDLRVKTEPEAKEPGRAFANFQAKLDFAPLQRVFGNLPYPDMGDALCAYLLPGINPDRKLLDAYCDKTTPEAYLRSFTLRLMTLPEYQLC